MIVYSGITSGITGLGFWDRGLSLVIPEAIPEQTRASIWFCFVIPKSHDPRRFETSRERK
jgi:hypothetical protein